MPDVDDETLILPADDADVGARLADGWTVSAESWGARLTVDDAVLRSLAPIVERAERAGYAVAELEADAADEVWTLQEATRSDFPVTPATPAPDASAQEVAALWSDGWRLFGARHDGALVGVTLVHVVATADGPPSDTAGYAETEWTAVLAAHRGRGVARALKAASVLAFASSGTRVFGTGGAAANTASLAMNAAVGYRVTERWVSLQRRR